ncbi:hypothetical protein [Micromonospora sp. NBRC 107095]|uniref:hypothetical protein n=1 Tax=Micromonospora sp. NBRC 107095 TaxID=3032209 RepID=UPI0024A2796F|nr:hypothetical protein [Micromonospora sp. NBRC 107095]GLZ57795.1 hypothetical protein Misp05_13710 [Micromonospora sp. NBRC 107095]
MSDEKLDEAGVRGGFDLLVTPDVRFTRLLRRDLRRMSWLFVISGLLLSITSLGTFTADGGWLLAGLFGVPFGAVWCIAGLINGSAYLRRHAELSAPVRYVFTAEAIEWHTAHAALRLPWTAIRHAVRMREAYRLDCADQQPRYLCRTTLAPAEDAQVAAYLDERLAARLAAEASVRPMPPVGDGA